MLHIKVTDNANQCIFVADWIRMYHYYYYHWLSLMSTKNIQSVEHSWLSPLSIWFDLSACLIYKDFIDTTALSRFNSLDSQIIIWILLFSVKVKNVCLTLSVFPPAGQFGCADSACSCFVSAGPPTPRSSEWEEVAPLMGSEVHTVSGAFWLFFSLFFFLSAYDTFPTRVETHGGTNPVKCTRITLTHSSDSMVPLTEAGGGRTGPPQLGSVQMSSAL